MRAREPWERNLYVLWVALVITFIGLGLIAPFIPLFIRQLGVQVVGRAALWAGIAGGVAAFGMMFTGPLWGMLGDRSGRKKNLLRSMFGFAVALAVASTVTNVYQLVAVWLLFGLVPGPGISAMTMLGRHGAQA